MDELKFRYEQARAGNKFAKRSAKMMEDEAEKELEEKYGDKLL